MGVKKCVAVLTAQGSSPHHTEPTTALVTTGPYAYSRNPACATARHYPCGFCNADGCFVDFLQTWRCSSFRLHSRSVLTPSGLFASEYQSLLVT